MKASGERLDVALTFSCHQIAVETEGLAFRQNNITFRSYAF